MCKIHDPRASGITKPEDEAGVFCSYWRTEVKYMARGLRDDALREQLAMWYIFLHKQIQQLRPTTTAIDDGTGLDLAVPGKQYHP